MQTKAAAEKQPAASRVKRTRFLPTGSDKSTRNRRSRFLCAQQLNVAERR